MKTKILSVDTSCSLRELLTRDPYLLAQLSLAGVELDDEWTVRGRQQFVSAMQQAIPQADLLLVVDGSEEFFTRELTAQGFQLPLTQDQHAAQAIRDYLDQCGRPLGDQLRYAQIPQGALPLTSTQAVLQGFALCYPAICIAVLPANRRSLLPMMGQQLVPLLLERLPGGCTVTVPIQPGKETLVQQYVDRSRNWASQFLAQLDTAGGSSVLRLTAVRATREEARQCCNSFLEDLSAECGSVSPISGLATRGVRAVEKQQAKLDHALLESLYLDEPSAPSRSDVTDTASSGADAPTRSRKELKKEAKKAAKQARRQQKAESASRKSFGDRVRSLLLTACVLVFVCCLGYLGYYYYHSAQNRSYYVSMRDLYDNPGLLPPAGYPSDYDSSFWALWQVNPDVVGWVSIEGTDLDYPVVQTDDNTTYYRTNFKGEYSEHAVPFVDCNVDLKEPSTNIIIYGHNIKTDGQMFNILKGYQDISFLQQHPVIEFNSVYHEGTYKIFSVFITNTRPEHGEIFPYHEFTDAKDAAEAQQYINDVLVRSIYRTGVDVQPSDELLTLSTCTYEFQDARFVVVARKVRDGESAEVAPSGIVLNPTPLYPDIWYELYGGTKPQLTAALDSLERYTAQISPDNDPVFTWHQSIPTSPLVSQEEPETVPTVAPAEEESEAESEAASSADPSPPAQTTPESSATQEQPSTPPAQTTPTPEASTDASGSSQTPSTPESTDSSSGQQDTASSGSTSQEESKPSGGHDVVDGSQWVSNLEEDPEKEAAASRPQPEEDPEDEAPAPSEDEEDEDEEESRPSGGSSSVGTLSVKVNGRTLKEDAHTIVSGIVQAEMGPTFQTEALKAQAVAAYTYVLYNNQKGVSPWVAYNSSVSSNVSRAVESVLGEVITYNGQPINATYCASNAGQSNDSASVWGGYLPYLVSVDSPGDTTLRAYGATKRFSEEEVAELIEDYCNVDPYDYDPEDWFSNPSYINGKYVNNIRVCGQKVTGRNVREGIMQSKIASSAFEVEYDGSGFVFTTYGYGHGVGMSQQGADWYAMKGWDYVDILTHYYTGVRIQ